MCSVFVCLIFISYDHSLTAFILRAVAAYQSIAKSASPVLHSTVFVYRFVVYTLLYYMV